MLHAFGMPSGHRAALHVDRSGHSRQRAGSARSLRCGGPIAAPLLKVPVGAWMAQTLPSALVAIIAALRPRTGGTDWVPTKAVVAIHPVAWSHWASAPMMPTRVAGLFCVRPDNPRLSYRGPHAGAAITTAEGVNSASPGMFVLMDISQIGKQDSSMISW
jgi:hypothetical protein